MNLFQKYGIKEVADVVFYSITQIGDEEVYTPVLYLDTLKVSTIEKTAEKVEAKGGKGNRKLITWNFGKEITLTLEDALFSPASMSMIMGGKLDSTFGLPMSALMKIQTANNYARNHYSTKAYPSPTLTDEEWEEVFRVLEKEKIRAGYTLEERDQLSNEFSKFYNDEYINFLSNDYQKDLFHVIPKITLQNAGSEQSYTLDFETIYNPNQLDTTNMYTEIFDVNQIQNVHNIFIERNRQKIKDNYYQRTAQEFLNMSELLLKSDNLIGDTPYQYYNRTTYVDSITNTNQLKTISDLFMDTNALGNEIIFPIRANRIAKGKLTLHNITLPNGNQISDILNKIFVHSNDNIQTGKYCLTLPITYSYSFRKITNEEAIIPEYDYNQNTDIISTENDVTGELTTNIKYYKLNGYLCIGIECIKTTEATKFKIMKSITPALLQNYDKVAEYGIQFNFDFQINCATTGAGHLFVAELINLAEYNSSINESDTDYASKMLKYVNIYDFLNNDFFINNTNVEKEEILSKIPIYYFFDVVNLSTNNNTYIYPVFCKDTNSAAEIFSHILRPSSNYWKGYPVAFNDCVVHALANDIKTYQDTVNLNTNIRETEIVDRMEKCLVKDKNGLEIDLAKQRQNLIRYYTNDKSSSYTIFYDAKTMLPIFYSPKDSSEHADIYQIDYISEQHQKVKLKMGTVYYKWTRTVMNLDDTGMNLGNTFVIDADTFPEAYKIVGETYIRNQKTGRDQRYQFTINRATVSSDTSVTLEAEGDPTTFSMTIDVLCPPNEVMMELKQYDIIEDKEQGGYQIKTQGHRRTQTPLYVEEFQRKIDVNNDEIY